MALQTSNNVFHFSNISNNTQNSRFAAICPVSDKRIDENVARLVAAQTVVLLLVFAFTQHWLPIAILLYDFSVRSAQRPSFSLLALAASRFAKLTGAKPKLQNAGPKIFAARIGLLFSALIVVSILAGSIPTALVFAGIFGFCALLEAAFAFCVACKIYPFVHALIYK